MHPIYRRLHSIVSNANLNVVDQMTTKILLKEYLQNHILHAIYNNKNTQDLIFYGGTALRKIHGLDRMSEDLDFESETKINLEIIASEILLYFTKLKFSEVEYKIQLGKIINRITFKFQILYDLGLSPVKSEKLHVKVEINPIAKTNDFETQLTPLMKDQMSIMIKHYSLSVMMAGKMCACLDRVFRKGKTGIKIKGRDYYDLIWYMNQKIMPDEKYLKKFKYSARSAFAALDNKVKKIKSSGLLFDLQPFFVSKKYINDWCKNFHQLYARYRIFYN